MTDNADARKDRAVDPQRGRLIINDRGEMVQVVNLGPNIILQTSVLRDAIVRHGEHGAWVCTELVLKRKEVLALILKLGDAVGVGVEISGLDRWNRARGVER